MSSWTGSTQAGDASSRRTSTARSNLVWANAAELRAHRAGRRAGHRRAEPSQGASALRRRRVRWAGRLALEGVLPAAEIAELIGVHPRTVRTYWSDGKAGWRREAR